MGCNPFQNQTTPHLRATFCEWRCVGMCEIASVLPCSIQNVARFSLRDARSSHTLDPEALAGHALQASLLRLESEPRNAIRIQRTSPCLCIPQQEGFCSSGSQATAGQTLDPKVLTEHTMHCPHASPEPATLTSDSQQRTDLCNTVTTQTSSIPTVTQTKA